MKILKIAFPFLALLPALALTSCPPAASTGPVTLFSETFENAYDIAWDTSSALYTWSFPPLAGLTGGNPSGSGSYAFSQFNTNANGDLYTNSLKYFFTTDISPTYVRFYMRAAQTDKEGGYVALWGPNPYVAATWFFFGNNGQFYARGSVVGAYAADTWYKIELKNIDYTNHTYDVYLDDALVISGQTINAAADAFGAIALYNIDAGSQFYYDDILIQQ
ncbi:MAG: hypothetical protein JXD23_03680 [Spirochaetales bacterium]|nr:hypothetical protein [Spirochaetales bacterium]